MFVFLGTMALSCHFRRPPTTPRGVSGGARGRKLVVGRGPRDQTGRQKPRARAPEALARPAALRFERANGREVGRDVFAAFTTGLRPETIFRGCFECV